MGTEHANLRLWASRALLILDIILSFPCRVLEQPLPFRDRILDGLVEFVADLVLAKKLFAYEEHSYTEAVSLDILVVPITGADLLAILDGIATEGHSGTVPEAMEPLVLAQALLDLGDDFGLRKEIVRAALNILLGEVYSTLEGLFLCQLTPWHGSLRNWI